MKKTTNDVKEQGERQTREHFRLTMNGRGEGTTVLIEGAKRVLACEQTRALLLLKGCRLLLTGEGIRYLTYASGAIEVIGRMAEIRFLKGEGDHEDITV